MLISELEKLLVSLREAEGDVEVAIRDADTGWIFILKEKHLCVSENSKIKMLEISHDYSDDRINACFRENYGKRGT